MKYLRLSILSLLFLGAVGALAGYLFFRRTVPVQSKYIPADAVLVLTADVRELGLNAKGGGELIAPRSGDGISKQLAALTRALSDNKGGGIAQTADIQLFLFRRGDAAWAAAAIELNDSAAFGKFMRSKELGREILITPLQTTKQPVFSIDSSGAVAGWNDETALLLYPVGNHTVAETAAQLSKLLTLQEPASIAASENFRNAMLQEFDLSLWVNPAEVVAFTQSKQLSALLGDMKQLHLAFDFTEGEVIIKRSIIENNDINEMVSTEVFPASSKTITGFWELNSKNLLHHPAADLFFDDEELRKQLANELSGNCTVLLHDTIGFTSHYYETTVDENFVTTQREVSTHAREMGYTVAYKLKENSKAANFLKKQAAGDTLIFNKNGVYSIETGTLRKSVWISGELLFVSTAVNPPVQLKAKAATDQSLICRVNLSQLFRLAASTRNDWPPQWLGIAALCAKHISSFSISRPIQTDVRKLTDEIRVKFTNPNINAMLQLRDITREATWLMQDQGI
ncbi:MAG: DUF4836 family protein [Bacteroidia bacterium]